MTRPAAARKSEAAQAASAADAGSLKALAAMCSLARAAAKLACFQICSRSVAVRPNRSVRTCRSRGPAAPPEAALPAAAATGPMLPAAASGPLQRRCSRGRVRSAAS